MSTFTDNKGWVPGLEFRNGGLLARHRRFRRRPVARATRRTPRGSSTRTAAGDRVYGLDFGFTKTGSGNPADEGVGYGTVIKVAQALDGNRAALIKVVAPTP